LQERIGIGRWLQTNELIEGEFDDGAHGVQMKYQCVIAGASQTP
jgi:hypothetical protein